MTMTMEQLMHLQELFLSGHELCSFRNRRKVKADGVLFETDTYTGQIVASIARLEKALPLYDL
jgi:hypothetical protein